MNNRFKDHRVLELKKPEITQEEKDQVMSSPCTIAEAVQIANAVASDILKTAMDPVIKNFNSIIAAQSLYIEILKGVVIEQGILTEDEFQKRYTEISEAFVKAQKENLEGKKVEVRE